jgi:2-polyprenyl-3-methyl-5-hydroxy-6-metoxy-1,4-benzoquinol methylase
MSVASHYDGSASSSADQYQRENLWTLEDYPANYFRLEILLRELAAAKATSLFEFGVGDATPLVAAAKAGMEVAGFDVSPEMVEYAKANLSANGLDPERICLADAQDLATLTPQIDRLGQFDAVMALGVIPHVSDDDQFVDHMSRFLKPSGQMFIAFRNSMFNLFTFNRLTKEFVLDELMAGVDESIRAVVEADLDARLAIDKPPRRTRDDGTPGYDEILARFHNPLELSDLIRRHGFSDVRLHWYHYHPAPPMLTNAIGATEYRKACFELEHEGSWRGMFLCSAGLIEAIKDPD